ncbi:unnamed protein product [Lymnaea stagnalis]|uniref:DUF1308 domain-containing protein n=1 Tax=Lymnaea stagnalis TaxID=6523 RepID=A0AAV2HHK6_LYMST
MLFLLNQQRDRVQASHIKSSNLSHFASLVHAAERLPGVVRVLQPFSLPSRADSLVVDIVAGNGHIWVKVIARKAQALHLVWAGKGQFGERDLVSQAEEYLECVKRHPHEFKTPQVVFAFYNQVTEAMSEALEDMGMVVLGERVHVDDKVQVKLESVLCLELDGCQALETNDEQPYDIKSRDAMCAHIHGISGQDVLCSGEEDIISGDVMSLHGDTGCQSNHFHWKMPEMTAKTSALGGHPASATGRDIGDGILETSTLQSGEQVLGGKLVHSYPDPVSAQATLDQTLPRDDALKALSYKISINLDKYNLGPYNRDELSPLGPYNREELSPLAADALVTPHHSKHYHQVSELKSLNEGSEATPGSLSIDMSSDTASPPSVPWDKNIPCPSRESPAARQRHDLFTDEPRQDLFLQLVVSPPVFSSLPASTSGSPSNKTGPPIDRVNLDITSLIALVSSVTNGNCHLTFRDKVLTQQALEERNFPILPVLTEFVQDKELFVCETAVSSFMSILDILGGVKEKERARELLARVNLVKDEPSQRSLGLKCQGRVKERSKVVFGTGDTLQAVTITSNMGFVRAAKGQGVTFPAFLHPARALTEEKEKYASPS